MVRRPFNVGDLVTVAKYVPGKYAPGVKDEMGTEALFQSLVGKTFPILGFDRYGNIELAPKRLTYIWIEPELVKHAAGVKSKGPRKARLQRTRSRGEPSKGRAPKARR